MGRQNKTKPLDDKDATLRKGIYLARRQRRFGGRIHDVSASVLTGLEGVKSPPEMRHEILTAATRRPYNGQQQVDIPPVGQHTYLTGTPKWTDVLQVDGRATSQERNTITENISEKISIERATHPLPLKGPSHRHGKRRQAGDKP